MSPTSKLADQLDWNLLRTFMAIVQAGSITRAANRLALTQPAVSSALRRLEERLEIRLIERGSGIVFTVSAEGEALYKHCISIYGNVAQIRNAITSPKGELKGRIIVIISNYLYVPDIFDYLHAFNRDYPGVNIEMYKGSCEEVRHALLRKVATMGVMALATHDEVIEQFFFPALIFKYYVSGKNADTPYNEMPFATYRAAEIHGSLQPLITHHVTEYIPAPSIKVSDLQDMSGLILETDMAGPLPAVFADNFGPSLSVIDDPVLETKIPLYLAFGKDAHFHLLKHTFCKYIQERISMASLP